MTDTPEPNEARVERCPTCGSNDPGKAVAWIDGHAFSGPWKNEVSCPDEFHLRDAHPEREPEARAFATLTALDKLCNEGKLARGHYSLIARALSTHREGGQG